MNSNDRTNFLQLSPPTDLDSSLGVNLATDLHNWIQNTYAVAFVSYMISQTSDKDQQTWRQHFSDDEKGKIWYWFSGQVKSLQLTYHYRETKLEHRVRLVCRNQKSTTI